MEAVQPELLLAQMQSLPSLLLIGIDPESHEVLLTGEAVHSITLDQITQILQSQDCYKEAKETGRRREAVCSEEAYREKIGMRQP
jgi:hypothetical protein